MASETGVSDGPQAAPEPSPQTRLIRVRIGHGFPPCRARLLPEVIWNLAKHGMTVVVEENQ
jgi:hypothetical protein